MRQRYPQCSRLPSRVRSLVRSMVNTVKKHHDTQPYPSTLRHNTPSNFKSASDFQTNADERKLEDPTKGATLCTPTLRSSPETCTRAPNGQIHCERPVRAKETGWLESRQNLRGLYQGNIILSQLRIPSPWNPNMTVEKSWLNSQSRGHRPRVSSRPLGKTEFSMI